MITSLQNSRVKWVRSLQAQSSFRRQEGVFVAEGVRLAEEAFQAGWTAAWFSTEDLNERVRAVVEGFAAHGAGRSSARR
jgi:tRNA G18 (ribose-2'-O)-methylase SpoU